MDINKNKIGIGIIILIILVFILFLFFTVLGLFFYLNNKNNDVFEYNYLKDIDYKVSDKFKKDTYSRDVSYSYSDDGLYCYINIDYSDVDYNNGEEYLKEMVYYNSNSKVSDISENTINDYKWYSMIVTTEDDYSNNSKYYYVAKKGMNFYRIEYEISDIRKGDRNTNFCETHLDSFISSIKFNK